MPIGLVSDEEWEREIASSKKEPLSEKESHTNGSGKHEGDINVPDVLRKIIGEERILNGRSGALSLARDLRVSPSSASAYANGATSTKTYHSSSQSLIEHLTKSRLRATKRASKTLNGALSAITQEKLDYSDAKDLSGIAKDMSVIIRNLEPPQQQTTAADTSPKFVIFAPQFRREDSFDVIDVKE